MSTTNTNYSHKLKNDITFMYDEWYDAKIDDAGAVTSQEYMDFQNQYRHFLYDMAKEVDCTLYGFYGNHYNFSAVLLSNSGNYIYLSISDVRYWPNEWADHILYRSMAHPQDWTGGINQYTKLKELPDAIKKLDEWMNERKNNN